MSNSSLINYTKLSPNCNKPRNKKISKITIHHMAGNLTVERCGDVFANPGRQASSNYGIGTDGRIGLYVDEANRSWCSSNADNDNEAVTIEVANCGGAPDWKVSDKALESLIALCADICIRNDIKELRYTGNKFGNLTRHNMFAATACPGPYLESKFPYIAAEVNKKIKAHTETQTNKNQLTTTNNNLYRVRKSWKEAATQKGAFSNLNNAINCAKSAGADYEVYDAQGKVAWSAAAADVLAIGDKVKLTQDAKYYTGLAMPQWVKDSTLYVRSIDGERIVISLYATGSITGAVDKKYIRKI